MLNRFNTEGKHFYCLTGEELKNFCVREIHEYKNLEKIRTLYLWTEKGALLHAKSLNNDKVNRTITSGSKASHLSYVLLFTKAKRNSVQTSGQIIFINNLTRQNSGAGM